MVWPDRPWPKADPAPRLGAFYERAKGHPLTCACPKCWWADWWHRQDVATGSAVPYLLGGQPSWGEPDPDFTPRRAGLMARLRSRWSRPPLRPTDPYATVIFK